MLKATRITISDKRNMKKGTLTDDCLPGMWWLSLSARHVVAEPVEATHDSQHSAAQ